MLTVPVTVVVTVLIVFMVFALVAYRTTTATVKQACQMSLVTLINMAWIVFTTPLAIIKAVIK